MRLRTILLAGALAGLAVYGTANAATYTVAGTDDLYRAGGSVSGDGGTDPVAIALNGATSLTFSATGSISLNIGTGSNYNDPDGVGSASSISVSALNGISGISAYHAGFLAGVFEGAPTTTPADLSYPDATSEGATSYAPALQQAFFIGDGLTGDGLGTTQTFTVPTGAKTLYLGITDASGYNGSPGAYGDNSGDFQVTVNGIPAAVPEPAAWAMMLAGFFGLGAMLRLQRKPSTATA